MNYRINRKLISSYFFYNLLVIEVTYKAKEPNELVLTSHCEYLLVSKSTAKVNLISLGFGLLVGQNKNLEENFSFLKICNDSQLAGQIGCRLAC